MKATKNKRSKDLYKFTINVEREVQKSVEKEENGETVTVTKTEIKKVPYEILIKKPTRDQISQKDMEYGSYFGKCLKAGMITKASLAKNYAESGGVWTKDEQKEFRKLYEKALQLEADIDALSVKVNPNDREKRQKLDYITELTMIRRDLADVEMQQSQLFDSTADVQSRNRAIMYYVVTLPYYRSLEEGEEGEFKPLFSGSEFDDRLEHYDELIEEEEPIFAAAIQPIISYTSYYFITGKNGESYEKDLKADADFRNAQVEREKEGEELADKSKKKKGESKDEEEKVEGKSQEKSKEKEKGKKTAKKESSVEKKAAKETAEATS